MNSNGSDTSHLAADIEIALQIKALYQSAHSAEAVNTILRALEAPTPAPKLLGSRRKRATIALSGKDAAVIRAQRIGRLLTQDQVAELAGVSAHVVSTIEGSERVLRENYEKVVAALAEPPKTQKAQKVAGRGPYGKPKGDRAAYNKMNWKRLRARNNAIPGFTAFVTKLRDVRTKKGWSQAQLSSHIGLHGSFVGAIENSFRVPSQARIKDIAKALGIDVKEFGDISFAPAFPGEHFATRRKPEGSVTVRV